jgi:hypothetical protein
MHQRSVQISDLLICETTIKIQKSVTPDLKNPYTTIEAANNLFIPL